jgi:hypothetical protein
MLYGFVTIKPLSLQTNTVDSNKNLQVSKDTWRHYVIDNNSWSSFR